MTTKTLAQLESDLISANELFLECEKRQRIADNAATDALNKVNSAQRAMDERIKELKKSSHLQTNWHSRHNASTGKSE